MVKKGKFLKIGVPIIIVLLIVVIFLGFKFRTVEQTAIPSDCINIEFVDIPNLDESSIVSCSDNDDCQDFIKKQGVEGTTQCVSSKCQLELCVEGEAI